MALNKKGYVSLAARMKLFSVRVMRHRNSLPREAAGVSHPCLRPDWMGP